jgi:hypothetical protein
MLRVLGSAKSLCDGLTRRDFLQAGALGVAGLGLDGLLRQQAARAEIAPASRSPSFGRAKRCILLYLFGAASQLETFDLKPDAPAEVRGELKPIRTRLPGLHLCELLPRLAGVIDRTTVVRSMTHPYPIHGSAYALTSTPTITIPMQLDAKDSRHWPYIGSVVEYLDERHARQAVREGTASRPVPRNVALPWLLSSRRPHPSRNGGPYGAFLGPKYDPIWTDFSGEATRAGTYEFEGKVTTCLDPYGGIKPDCHFRFSSADSSPAAVTLDRLEGRYSLLQQLEQARRQLDRSAVCRNLDRYQQLALSLLTSRQAAEALDVHREPLPVREHYGMTLFGQACLAARRLLEAGVPFVTVFWDEYGSVNSAWDTHYYHYPRLKEHLLPGLDHALATLLADLETRGLLEETLVACITEHGRTPKLANANGGGRDHWSQAYASLFAGGGIAAGKVVGRTDRLAADVSDTPISPKDILATMYYLLGFDPHTPIADRLGRPVPIAGDGRVRHELLA